MNPIGIEDRELSAEAQMAGVTVLNLDRPVSFRNRFERTLTAIEVLADWLTVVIAIEGGYAVYRLLDLGRKVHYSAGTILWASCAVGALFVILLDRDGAYHPGNSLLRIKETERSLRVSMQALLLVFPITFFSRYMFSRGVFVIAMVSVPILQVVEKQILFVVLRALRSRGLGVQRVLIYGAGYSGRRVFSALVRSPKMGLHPVALIDDNPELAGQEVFEYAYRRGHSISVSSEPLTSAMLQRNRCELLIIAIPSLDREKFAGAVAAAREAKARLAYLPGQAVSDEYWTEPADIDGLLLNVVGGAAINWQYEMVKRPFDFLVSLVLAIVLAPIWLAIAILVRLDTPGPVLFRQQRVGKHGRLFYLYKFRSMIVDAPKYAFSPTDSADPRITRIGRFLRRTSLDELPQLLNVLRGDMSLVGPRPEMPFIVTQYDAQHRQRLQVMPGITGLWQLSADRAFLIHENIQYDLYYIHNRSFFMDFAILLHTAVFAMRGV